MEPIAIHHVDGSTYHVTIGDGRDATTHEVAVWPSDIERYAPGASPEALLRASFAFLLEREPKTAILRRFELPVIERYFPDYPAFISQLVESEPDYD